MGYTIGGPSSGPSITCGWLWWKKTCAWFETGITTGSIEDWFDNYPNDPYPSRKFKCGTCGKIEWR